MLCYVVFDIVIRCVRALQNNFFCVVVMYCSDVSCYAVLCYDVSHLCITGICIKLCNIGVFSVFMCCCVVFLETCMPASR